MAANNQQITVGLFYFPDGSGNATFESPGCPIFESLKNCRAGFSLE